MIDTEPVNWVKNRRECTLEFIFKQILYKRFASDMAEANKGNRQKPFEISDVEEQSGRLIFRVQRNGSPRQQASVRLDDDGISIHPYMETNFAVTQKWCDKTAECILHIWDEPVEPWQLSRRALSSLFFGD